jgi:hypothetical protein
MVKITGQDHRCRKNRSGQTTATGFVATGFQKIIVVKRQKHDAKIAQTQSAFLTFAATQHHDGAKFD